MACPPRPIARSRRRWRTRSWRIAGRLTEVRDRGGSFRALNPPFRLSAAEAAARPWVAALGEHTAAVLASWAMPRARSPRWPRPAPSELDAANPAPRGGTGRQSRPSTLPRGDRAARGERHEGPERRRAGRLALVCALRQAADVALAAVGDALAEPDPARVLPGAAAPACRRRRRRPRPRWYLTGRLSRGAAAAGTASTSTKQPARRRARIMIGSAG